MDPYNFRNYDPITNEYKSIFPTDLALRPKDLNTLGKQILVRINQYKVLDWPQGQIYQYDVMVGSGSEKPGKIRLVWNSPTVQNNLRGLDSHWLFDGNRIAWCMKDGGVAENKMLVDLDELRGRTPKPGKEDKCRVVIKRTKVITMAALKGYLDGKMAWDNTVLESINLLDHVLRQYPSEQMIGIKRSFYTDLTTTVRHSLDTLVEAQKGVYASMRLCSVCPLHSLLHLTHLTNNIAHSPTVLSQVAPVWRSTSTLRTLASGSRNSSTKLPATCLVTSSARTTSSWPKFSSPARTRTVAGSSLSACVNSASSPRSSSLFATAARRTRCESSP